MVMMVMKLRMVRSMRAQLRRRRCLRLWLTMLLS